MMKKFFLVYCAILIVIFLFFSLLLGFTSADEEKKERVKFADYIESLRASYEAGFQMIIVRMSDEPALLCGFKKNEIISTDYFKTYNSTVRHSFKLPKVVMIAEPKDLQQQQQIKFIVTFNKNEEISKLDITIDQSNSAYASYCTFMEKYRAYQNSTRLNLLALPRENTYVSMEYNIDKEMEVLPIDLLLHGVPNSQLCRSCDYFFTYLGGAPNRSTFSLCNICLIFDGNTRRPPTMSSAEFTKRRPESQDFVLMTNKFATIFEKKPINDVTIKDAPSTQLTTSIVDNISKEAGQCVVSWELTSDPKHELCGAWLRCDVDAGVVIIGNPKSDEPQTDEYDPVKHYRALQEKTPAKLERPEDNGKITISKIPQTGCNVTFYAITADGKTWYKRQIKIDPKSLTKKIVFPNDLEYREFESFDGQYYIEAKLVSFEIDKDNKKVVILEKKEDHKKIPTHLNKLSKDDQNYIQEKIDTQKKKNIDPKPKH